MAKARNPLEPAATSVYTMLALLGTVMGLAVVGTLLGTGSVFGIGSAYSCVDTRSGTVPMPQRESNVVEGVRDHVTSSIQDARMCVNAPSVEQRLLDTLTQLPTFLVLAGALLLAWRLIRGASREGILTVRTAGRLRVLGWFVLAGEPAATLVEALARRWLVNSMMRTPLSAMSWINDWQLPVPALFLGAVLISMARIMRISAAMREDLEGTV